MIRKEIVFIIKELDRINGDRGFVTFDGGNMHVSLK